MLTRGELVGRPPEASDLPELAALLGDPRVGRTLGGVRSPEEVGRLLERWRRLWSERGFGPFVFREASRFVGYAGLQPASALPAEIELFYAVAPALWGRGFATRASELVLRFAFGEVGLEALVAYTLETNAASRRVIEKLGFAPAGDLEHAGQPHVLYRLAAPPSA